MKTPAITAVWAGVALALACGAAVADSRGAGAVTSVTYTLIDLNPNDGIAPSITFASSVSDYAGPTATGYVRASTPDEDIYREYTRYGASPSSAISGGTSTAWSSTSSSAVGVAGVGVSSMKVKGEALSTADISGVYYSAVESPLAHFTLSANTAVVFTATGWLTGQTTLGGDPDTGFVENGGAVLQLETRGPGQGGDTVYDRQQADAVAWYTQGANGAVSGESKSWQGVLTSGYSNTNAFAVEGQFGIALSVAGTSVAGVPEPSTYAMLLAGLAGVGCIARRRQSTATRA